MITPLPYGADSATAYEDLPFTGAYSGPYFKPPQGAESASHRFGFPKFHTTGQGWIATWECKRCGSELVHSKTGNVASHGWIGACKKRRSWTDRSEANEITQWTRGEGVVQTEADRRGLTLASLQGKSRRKHLVSARRAVVKKLWAMEFKLHTIGMLLGGRDHTTIIYLRDTDDPVYREGP